MLNEMASRVTPSGAAIVSDPFAYMRTSLPVVLYVGFVDPLFLLHVNVKSGVVPVVKLNSAPDGVIEQLAIVTVTSVAIAVEAARANVASESKNFFILLLCFELYVFFIASFFAAVQVRARESFSDLQPNWFCVSTLE